MRAAVHEEGRQAVAERGGNVVDGEGEVGEREVAAPGVLAAAGVGSKRVANDAVGPLHLGVGVLAVGRADEEARAHALNTLLVNLASWSTTSASEKPAPDRRLMSRMITAASVERAGTACTLPDSSSTWVWVVSKPEAVVGSPAIQSIPIIPPRRDGRGKRWRSPRGPTCSDFKLVRWHVWQERATQRRRNPPFASSLELKGAPLRL